MKNFAGIAGTKFGSEAVMKSEAAFQNFETPLLRAEVRLQKSEVRLRGSDTNIGVSKALNQRLRVNVWLHLRQRYMSRSVVRKEKKNTAPKKAMNGMAAHR